MRTRFLHSDYFNSATETLEFFHCPPPNLPPPSYSSLHEDLRRCFDEVSTVSISLEIGKLPIEASLNKFLSDVLPQFIDVEIRDFADDLSAAGTALSGKQRSFGAHLALELEVSEKKNKIFSEEEEGMYISVDGILKEKDETVKGTKDVEIIQFEIPEKYDLHTQKESMKIFSEIPRVETKVEMLSLERRIQDFLEIQQAVYSVDSVSIEYFMEQKADILEDFCSTGGQLGSSVTEFPLFEIDEASLGIFNDLSVKDEFINLENIELEKWTQVDEITSNIKEHSGFKEFDLLAYLSNHCSAMQHPEVEVTCSNFFTELDFIIDNYGSDTGQMLPSHQGAYEDISICSRNIIIFDEFQFIDLELYNLTEVFYDLSIMCIAKACDSMFSEAMKFKNFNDLIACNELILIDDSFRSLPVPILVDSEKTWSFQSLVEKIFCVLEPESSSTFDGLYLDWHVIEDESCNNKYSSCWKAFEEIDTYSINSTLNIIDNGMLVLDFVLSDGSLDKLNLGENKEILKINLHDISIRPISHKEVAPQKLLIDDDGKGVLGEVQSEIEASKVYIAVETTAEFNAIDFLLNPRECAGGGKKCKTSESIYKETVLPTTCSHDPLAACAITQVPLQQWDIKILQVELSDEILILVDNLRKSFQGILRSDTELLKDLYPSKDMDNISCLRVQREELLNRIKKTSTPGTPLALADENITSLVALCAIKQMAWYLCYYGLHATQLYMDNLSTNFQCLKSRLSFLQNLIHNMCRKAEKEITKFHPSLSVVQQVLQSSCSEIGLKVLIVAEPVFWWPLKRLLTSMKISYVEPQNFWTKTCQHDGLNDFADPRSIIFQEDCCLVSHENFSASFPYDKFGIILEYGGSHESSRVCSLSSKQDHGPYLYFLKVNLEESGVPKAICNGVNLPIINGSTMQGDSRVILVLNQSNNKMEEVLNYVPVEENYNKAPVEAVEGDQECYLKPLHSVLLAMESKEINTNKPSSPDTVILVNTKNFDKEMVISRRSTYQKILALEKGGAQVVERDLNLPVDIIVDAAICLAWYDLKNIGKKSSAPDKAFSCLPLCVENIAASILTSLSYAFSRCILVFEGEKHFLASVMESSDELYAAAASLGIDLQIFYSYAAVMTDEIILSCIEAVSKLTRGLYPKMPDSESLAESFLTAFPSINPLSAHAILSSGSTLIEFLEWPHERRILAVQKHKIPDESIALLGLLCRYGEQDDSRSGMTDSSSSVSYVPDRFQPGSNSATRKRKCTDNLPSIDVYGNNFSHFEPVPLSQEVRLSPSSAAAPLNIWMSENSDIVDECEKIGVSLDDKLLGQSKKVEANMMRNYSTVAPLYSFGITEGFPTSEETQKPKDLRHNTNFSAEERLHRAGRDKSYRLEKEKSGNQQEDLIGEVINTDFTATFRREISELNPLSFSPCEVKEDWTTGASRTARNLSIGSSSFASFPKSAEIDSNLDAWICQNNHENSSRKGNKNTLDYCSNNHEFYPKHQGGLLHVNMPQKTATNSYDRQMPEKDGAYCGGTPLWDAIHSSQPLRESPWTMEFLNRIKEKSKTRHQSLPCGTSAPCFGSSRNKANARKRKSPSILEYYKYRRVGDTKISIDQKRQKRSVKPSCLSKNESNSIRRTCTPVDKKAKRTLSFTTTGNGGQRKLIWSDKNSPTLSRKVFLQL